MKKLNQENKWEKELPPLLFRLCQVISSCLGASWAAELFNFPAHWRNFIYGLKKAQLLYYFESHKLPLSELKQFIDDPENLKIFFIFMDEELGEDSTNKASIFKALILDYAATRDMYKFHKLQKRIRTLSIEDLSQLENAFNIPRSKQKSHLCSEGLMTETISDRGMIDEPESVRYSYDLTSLGEELWEIIQKSKEIDLNN